MTIHQDTEESQTPTGSRPDVTDAEFVPVEEMPAPSVPMTAPAPGVSPVPPTPTTPPPGAGRAPRRMAIGALVLAALVGTFFVGRATVDNGTPAPATTTLTQPSTTGTIAPSSDEPVAAVARALAPSVVQLETQAGLGSGIVYSADGYILTAAHVVTGFQTVTVRLADGTTLTGRVVGIDTNSDVGVVKVDRTGLTPASLATGVPLEVGQMAIAIGSPFGLDQTVTAGVVSAVARAVPLDNTVRTMIQTDAPINPGNSGGALADRSGQVIGINDAIYSTTGGNNGVGFAIPIDTAVSVGNLLISGQPIKTAYLGINGTDPSTGQGGALVTGVVPGSPAAAAGLQTGDLIISLNGEPVESMVDLAGLIRSFQPGLQVSLQLVRSGQTSTIQVTLGEAQ